MRDDLFRSPVTDSASSCPRRRPEADQAGRPPSRGEAPVPQRVEDLPLGDLAHTGEVIWGQVLGPGLERPDLEEVIVVHCPGEPIAQARVRAVAPAVAAAAVVTDHHEATPHDLIWG